MTIKNNQKAKLVIFGLLVSFVAFIFGNNSTSNQVSHNFEVKSSNVVEVAARDTKIRGNVPGGRPGSQ